MRTFDKSYLQMAEIWSQNSRAIRAKVGALIVKDNMIISDGFNGTPSGFENECETVESCELQKHYYKDSLVKCPHKILPPGCPIVDNNCPLTCEHANLKTKEYVLHAEANAITKLAKSGNSAQNATLYVTLSPCVECAKLIIQAGIKRVVYTHEYRDLRGLEILRRAGIKVEQLSE